jgi:hypothetical protein
MSWVVREILRSHTMADLHHHLDNVSHKLANEFDEGTCFAKHLFGIFIVKNGLPCNACQRCHLVLIKCIASGLQSGGIYREGERGRQTCSLRIPQNDLHVL